MLILTGVFCIATGMYAAWEREADALAVFASTIALVFGAAGTEYHKYDTLGVLPRNYWSILFILMALTAVGIGVYARRTRAQEGS